MITSGSFGVAGRLGNQMFQLGLLFAISSANGHRFALRRAGEQIWECFRLDVPEAVGELTHQFHETGGSCNFDGRVFEQPDRTIFYGYYQSYRYYERCRSEIVSFFQFQERHLEHAAAEVARLRAAYGLPLVSVHYRRTDYLLDWSMPLWGNLHADGYYDRVFEHLGSDVLYLVFSDDIAWCRQNVRRRHVEFADFDASVSLCMMTLCDVNVVANSSFSWWGAYLNRSGTALAPARWFGMAMPPPNDRQADIVPPEWTTISALTR